MVPAAIVELPTLPRTPAGKVDRAALAATASRYETPAVPSAEGVSQPHELAIISVWKDVLGIEEVGTSDNFFDLGGHSLLLAKVQSRIESRLGQRLPILALFRHPTVRALAQHLESQGRDAAELVPAAPDPLTAARARALRQRAALDRSPRLQKRTMRD
jgi:acyl carrier protein